MEKLVMNDLVKSIDGIIDNVTPEYGQTVKDYQWSLIPNSQLHAAKAALTKTDYIMKIAANNPGSVHSSLIQAGILGVDLTDGKRQGYLLPRKVMNQTQIVLQVGYKGHEAIAQRMGTIDRLSVRLVYEKDEFDWSGDESEKPNHKANWFDKERGNLIGVFSITYFPGGDIQVIVTPISEIYEKHRDKSDSWQSYQKKLANDEKPYPPPWVTFEEEMVKKTQAYIASKQFPANIRNDEVNSKILETLHQVDTSDYKMLQAGVTTEQREAFSKFVETANELGAYLFRLYVGNDAYSAICRLFIDDIPRGGKMSTRSTINDLDKNGIATYDDICNHIDQGDWSGIYQHLEEQEDVVIRMLDKALTEERRAKLMLLAEENELDIFDR
jgi:phage RecT family recombinase